MNATPLLLEIAVVCALNALSLNAYSGKRVSLLRRLLLQKTGKTHTLQSATPWDFMRDSQPVITILISCVGRLMQAAAVFTTNCLWDDLLRLTGLVIVAVTP
jgi:hypothetical protein